MCPGVPNRSYLIQATADGLQVRACLAFLIPAALEHLPQFVYKSKTYRLVWLVWPNSLKYGIVNPPYIPTMIRFVSA